MIHSRSPRVDFDNARLHETQKSRQLIDRDHWNFVSGVDAADTGVQSLPRMLGEKTLSACARWAPQQTQGTTGDMRKNPVGNVDVEIGQSLFGDSCLFPKNPFRMSQVDVDRSWRNSRFRSPLPCLQNNFLRRLVIPKPLERRGPEQSVLRPAAIFDLADEAGVGPSDSFLDAGRERFYELRLCRI